MVKTVTELKDVFYAKDKKLDIFEQINMKLAQGEADRKILDTKLDYNVQQLKT